MKKLFYRLVGFLAVVAVMLVAAGAAYRSGAASARALAAFENVFEAQNLYLADRSDSTRGVIYIDAVVAYDTWGKNAKQRVVNVEEYSDALSRHGEAYKSLFQASTVYSMGEGKLFLGLREPSLSTVKSIRFGAGNSSFTPQLGAAGGEVMLEYARLVERRLGSN